MKRKLSSEAAGTLLALRDLYKIKSFSPDCGEELCAGGYTVQKGRHLHITDKGLRKAEKLCRNLHAAEEADLADPEH